jgi:glycosyltransferase involved in cell wall biosynthesis
LKKYSFPIRWVITERRQITSENRNCALELLKKDMDYVTLIDSDDEMLPRRLEFLMKAFQETQCDFIMTNFINLTLKTDVRVPWVNEYHCFENSFVPKLDSHGGASLTDRLYKRFGGWKNAGLHNAQTSFKTKIFDICKFDEKPESFRIEDSLFNSNLILKGFAGSYIYTQLAIYHCYQQF